MLDNSERTIKKEKPGNACMCLERHVKLCVFGALYEFGYVMLLQR